MRNSGSLREMFSCSYFNIHMLIKYLECHDELLVVEHLIQILQKQTMGMLDLYLPQICYLVLTKESPECTKILEKLVLDISILHPNIGFRALHYFQSWSEDSAECKYLQRANNFYNLLEQALVNQSLPKQFQTEAPKLLEMSEYIDKRFKADYIAFQLSFMNDLRKLSLDLKDPQIKLQS